MRRAPLLRVVLALAAGILLAEYLPSLPVGLLWLVAAVAVALMAVAMPMRHRGANFLFTFLLWLVLVVVGWLLGILHATDPAQGLPAEGWGTKDKNRTTLVATLTDTPRSAPRTYKVTAHVEAVCCDTAWKAADCRIMLYLAKDSASGNLRYGDRLLLPASSTTAATCCTKALAGRPLCDRGNGNPSQPRRIVATASLPGLNRLKAAWWNGYNRAV